MILSSAGIVFFSIPRIANYEELDNKHHGINTEDKQLSSDSNKNKKRIGAEAIEYLLNMLIK